MMNAHHRRRSDKQVTSDFCRRFGAVAVHRKYATADQVKAAIMEQLDDDINGREHRLLGSILYDKGWITDDQIEAVLLEIRKSIL
jgi:hypothetical protein